MSFSLIQSQKAGGPSLTLPNPTTAGSLLVVCAMPYQSTGTAMPVTAATLGGVADNFASAAIYSGESSGYGQGASIWFDSLCAGGQTAVAVSGTNLGWTYGGIAAFEFATGADMALDRVSSDNVASANWTSGTTDTTTSPDEILIGCGCIFDVPNSPDVSWTATIVNTFASAAYQIVSSEGQYAYFGTTSSGPLEVASIATFKAKQLIHTSGGVALRSLAMRGIGLVPTGFAPGSVAAANAAPGAAGRNAASRVTPSQQVTGTVTARNST